MRKEGLTPDPGCEWDKGGGFTKSGPGDSQMHSPRSCFLSVSCGPISGHRVAARGKWRWTGATPPFCCPVRARGCCAIHICAAPPRGVAPVEIIPGGKARNATRDGQDGAHERLRHPQGTLWERQCLSPLPEPCGSSRATGGYGSGGAPSRKFHGRRRRCFASGVPTSSKSSLGVRAGWANPASSPRN